MKVVVVDNDKTFVKEIEESFKKTHRIFTFSEMFEAYKWMKFDENIPDVIVAEIDLHQPTGLQTLKFLLTKSKLKNTHIVGFTNHALPDNEKQLITSEGASEVFEKKNLVSGLSTYLKYLSELAPKNKATKKAAGKNKPH